VPPPDRNASPPPGIGLCWLAAGLSLLLVGLQLAVEFQLGRIAGILHLGTGLAAVVLHIAASRLATEMSELEGARLWTGLELWTARVVAGASVPCAALALFGLRSEALDTCGALAGVVVFLAANRLRQRARLMLQGTSISQAILHSPAATIIRSFASAIVVGALLLALPVAGAAGGLVGPIDALFTSTSATCVTGLIVKDTPVDFTPFGHLVILLLIQAGGLGIMTLAGIFSAARGERFSLHHRMTIHDTVSMDEANMGATLGAIARYTFALEAAGALVLFLRWWLGGDMRPLTAAWLASFHSISAFCNAGFSLFSNSLEGYAADPIVNLTVGGLIVVGGLGFPVMSDLNRYVRRYLAGERARITLHSKLVLVTTAGLLLMGFVGFLALEWPEGLGHRGAAESAYVAGFQSITTRTAGFNTVPVAPLADATKFLFVLLMFVGASPGSTGGGIKTSTLAVLSLIGRTMMHGGSQVSVFGRSVPEAVRHRAVAIVILFGLGLLGWTFALSISEHQRFLDLMFETASAFATVGLSAGVTPQLTPFGRLAIIAAMFLGRVGPLTVALAVSQTQKRFELEYPGEDVMVG